MDYPVTWISSLVEVKYLLRWTTTWSHGTAWWKLFPVYYPSLSKSHANFHSSYQQCLHRHTLTLFEDPAFLWISHIRLLPTLIVKNHVLRYHLRSTWFTCCFRAMRCCRGRYRIVFPELPANPMEIYLRRTAILPSGHLCPHTTVATTITCASKVIYYAPP